MIIGVVFQAVGASAQSFNYWPVNGTVNVPFPMDTSADQSPPRVPASNRAGTEFQAEFVHDPWGGANPMPIDDNVPWATRRIAGNLQMRYRILGNPYLRQAGIRFEQFAMNTTQVDGTNDLVTLGWFNSAPATLAGNPSLANGNWPFPVTTTVYGSGANSLTWPGMVFRVVTGLDVPHRHRPVLC